MRTLRRFEYFAPTSLEEAVSILSKYGDKAKILAGGTDLVALMKKKAIRPDYLINIKKILGLSYIKYNNEGLRIGALTTIRTIEKSTIIQEKYPLLYEATKTFATLQVRNMAAIGGNICRSSPSADMASPLLALNSKVKIFSPSGEKNIPLERFFTGPGQNVLSTCEILVAVNAPPLKPSTGTAFIKLVRVAEDLAKVNVAAFVTVKDNIFEDVRIALGAVAPTPIRARKAEESLEGKRVKDKAIEKAAIIASKEAKPITDVRSTAEYRKKVSAVLVKRALEEALEHARGGVK